MLDVKLSYMAETRFILLTTPIGIERNGSTERLIIDEVDVFVAVFLGITISTNLAIISSTLGTMKMHILNKARGFTSEDEFQT